MDSKAGASFKVIFFLLCDFYMCTKMFTIKEQSQHLTNVKCNFKNGVRHTL